MSRIEIDADQMGVVLARTEAVASDASTVLNAFAITVDGGVASDKLAFVTQAAMEAAQLSIDAAYGVTSVGRAAIDGQLGDETEIYEALNNFFGKTFD